MLYFTLFITWKCEKCFILAFLSRETPSKNAKNTVVCFFNHVFSLVEVLKENKISHKIA